MPMFLDEDLVTKLLKAKGKEPLSLSTDECRAILDHYNRVYFNQKKWSKALVYRIARHLLLANDAREIDCNLVKQLVDKVGGIFFEGEDDAELTRLTEDVHDRLTREKHRRFA